MPKAWVMPEMLFTTTRANRMPAPTVATLVHIPIFGGCGAAYWKVSILDCDEDIWDSIDNMVTSYGLGGGTSAAPVMDRT